MTMRLPGNSLPQPVVELDGLIDGLRRVGAFPIGQDVRGDEIDGRDELRMIDPGGPDFASGNRNRA